MTMSFWVIVSWVFVFLLTAVNVVVFLKLKQASEQMMKMAFPNAKNMNEAMTQMQGMLGGMQGMQGLGGMMGQMGKGPGRPGANPFGGAGGKQNADAQLKAAMEMLNKMKR
jgi:hypothetical protein